MKKATFEIDSIIVNNGKFLWVKEQVAGTVFGDMVGRIALTQCRAEQSKIVLRPAQTVINEYLSTHPDDGYGEALWAYLNTTGHCMSEGRLMLLVPDAHFWLSVSTTDLSKFEVRYGGGRGDSSSLRDAADLIELVERWFAGVMQPALSGG